MHRLCSKPSNPEFGCTYGSSFPDDGRSSTEWQGKRGAGPGHESDFLDIAAVLMVSVGACGDCRVSVWMIDK